MLKAIALAFLLAVQPASAATFFNGEYVGGAYLFPDDNSVYQAFTPIHATPLTQIEGNLGGSGQTLMLTNSSIFVDYSATDATYWTPAIFNGFYLSDIYGKIPAFTSAGIKLTTNLVDEFGNPFTFANLSLQDDRIYVNWQGMTFNQQSVFRLDFAPPVPEPATWAMMIAGFATLGFSLRRRRTLASV